MRTCIKCGRNLPIDDFYKRLDGRNRNVCKECYNIRIKYTQSCKVDLNTNSLRHYRDELMRLFNLLGCEEFRGDLSKEILGLALHHKAIKHGALIKIHDGGNGLHSQWFKFSIPCIDWLSNNPKCSKSLKK